MSLISQTLSLHGRVVQCQPGLYVEVLLKSDYEWHLYSRLGPESLLSRCCMTARIHWQIQGANLAMARHPVFQWDFPQPSKIFTTQKWHTS